MANSVFVDTNGWLILLNSAERLHDVAQKLWLDLANRNWQFVLTDWIVAETGNALARTQRKTAFAEVVREVLESPMMEVVQVDRQTLTNSLSLYATYTDKFWGLVDCASFLVMRERGIAEAFTSDRHFEQAGFNCLLPSA